MVLECLVRDEKGIVGPPGIPVIQGEAKTLQVFWFKADGTPFDKFSSISELVVKIFSQINQSSIQKKFSTGAVLLFQSQLVNNSNVTTPQPYTGFQFSLTAADTANIAANNSGSPISFVITDASGVTTEIDLPNTFSATPPLITT